MKKKSLTYIVSDMSKMIALEWIIEYRDKDLTDLSFIFLNKEDSEIEQFVKQRGVPFLRIPYRGKQDLPAAILQSRRFLKQQKTEIVHCHLFDANMVGLIAARLAGIKKRVYTRHYATYHHVYFPKAVKYDRFVNAMASDIIAISRLVQDVLIEKEQVSPQKIHLVHHGFLVNEYHQVPEENIQRFKAKYAIQDSDVVVGVVARYTLLKGIQHIIPAFKKLLNDIPHAKLLIANSHGNDEEYLRTLLDEIPRKQLIEVKYERDMGALYKSLDAYVHVPIYEHIEAFGQTYVEALLAGVPSVFTLSGVAQEFIEDEKNALVVPFEESDAIYKALLRIHHEPALRAKLVENGFKDACALFSLEKMIQGLEQVYTA